jgi:Acetyltransferase (GNAT) family.
MHILPPGDRDAWIDVEKGAREFSTHEEGLRAWERYYAAHEDELPSRMFFVVTDAGEKVATATAFYDVFGNDTSGDAWLHWVAVRREHQGKGLSKPLITHTIARMRALGYTRAKIPTQTTTWLACKIYLSLGFAPTPESLVRDAVGWRIIKRLTDAPLLAEIAPATDAELFAPTL